jgi:hypothetical protein
MAGLGQVRGPQRMSIKIMNLIWEVAPYRGNTLLTFLALGDWSNDEGVCWPRIETLAKKSRQSVRSAQYALDELQKDGMVAVVVNPGRGHQNEFQINAQKLHQLRNDEKVQSAPQMVQNATVKGAKRDSAIRKNHQEPPKNQEAISPKLLDRLERDRRARFTEAAKSGLRDFEKYPREAWELS